LGGEHRFGKKTGPRPSDGIRGEKGMGNQKEGRGDYKPIKGRCGFFAKAVRTREKSASRVKHAKRGKGGNCE